MIIIDYEFFFSYRYISRLILAINICIEARFKGLFKLLDYIKAVFEGS